MNLRTMTIVSVFSIALGFQLAVLAADDRGTGTNPLRGPDRSPATDNDLRPYAAQPSVDSESRPQTQPGFWRNPGWFRPADAPAPSGINPPPNATHLAPSAGARDAGPAPAAQPQRTLIQRIRERRLVQLEKQAERLRQMSERDSQRPPGVRNSANPNGPESPDLQIDLGMPLDAPDAATANPAPSGNFAVPGNSNRDWPPNGPPQPLNARPPELNPPADPPIDIQIDLPSDVEPPQPKPPLQARVRSWWSGAPR